MLLWNGNGCILVVNEFGVKMWWDREKQPNLNVKRTLPIVLDCGLGLGYPKYYELSGAWTL